MAWPFLFPQIIAAPTVFTANARFPIPITYALTCFPSEVILVGQEGLLFARVVIAWEIGTRCRRMEGAEHGCFLFCENVKG